MLNAELQASLIALLGADVVSLQDHEIHRHSYDWWPLAAKWKQLDRQPYKPDAVVYATDAEQISTLLKWACANHVAVTPWGNGSSVTGAPLPTAGGVVLDLMRMERVLDLNETNLTVTVEAGKMGHLLEHELNARGYTLNHSPQSLDRSTVGGWIATRATGQFSSRYGGIEDLAIALRVVLPTGEIVNTRSTPRAAIGPDLKHVFMGAEGTMGVIVEVTLRIFPLTTYRRFEALRFPGVEAGVTAMRQIMRAGLKPFLLRFYDEDEARHAMRDKQFDSCVMFTGFDGQQRVTDAEYDVCMEICAAQGGMPVGSDAVESWMLRRFDFSTVENLLAKPGGVAETIEVGHYWDRILPTYYALKEALMPLADEALGHFSHVYTTGTSLYMILLGEVATPEEAEERIRQFWEVSMRICLQVGAVTSHHHGAGLARQPYIRQDLGSSMIVLERMKQAMDPAGIANPGKLGL
jgi:alkyldihydroxyacetonephosphate synthase